MRTIAATGAKDLNPFISFGSFEGDTPGGTCGIKHPTFEQTQSKEVRDKVQKALPASARKKLGHWSVAFNAAREDVRPRGSA